MNHVIHNQHSRGPDDDRLLDRLVDGELPDAERRKLLLKFEKEPDGWRRCALAFLEAQASLNPLVKNWQQKGYSVETDQRLVSMESKDGRKVKLPVQEVRIRYIGDRIY